MNLQALFNQIESLQYSLNYTVLSGFSTVRSALKHDKILALLIEFLRLSPTDIQTVYDRLLALLPHDPHPEYAYRYVEAILGYLYVLNQTDPGLGHQAAEHVFNTPKTGWAWALARDILQTPVETK